MNGAAYIPLRSIPASPPLRASIPDAGVSGGVAPIAPSKGKAPCNPAKRRETEDRRRPYAPLPRGPPAPLLRREAGDPRSRGTKARRCFCLSVSLKDGAGDLLHSTALHSEELPHPSKRPAHHPQRAAPLATPERGKNGLPAADLPSVLRRASSPQPTSSSAPSGHDRRRPGCRPAAQLRPYGRTARFRQSRSLEAEATITPRCARRHRVPGKPTDPAHHHKGRCPLHPRVRRLTRRWLSGSS